MKKHSAMIAFAIGLLMAASTHADVVDFLDFSTDGDGVIHRSPDFALPNSPVAGGASPNDWLISYDPINVATDTTLNEFQVQGGVMRVQDWGGVGTLTGNWMATSDGTIDIEGVGVTIGNAPFNSTVVNGPGIFVTEGITWFYQVNSDPIVEVTLDRVALTGDAGTPVTAGTSVGNIFEDIEVSAGDNISYGFWIAVEGENDGVEISSVTIDFSPVPEPASGLIIFLGGIGWATRRRRS